MTGLFRSFATFVGISILAAPALAASTATHHLSGIGFSLGDMSETDYDAVQLKWIGSDYPACNFFVETAMCVDGMFPHGTPDSLVAAEFGTYLKGIGWTEIDLDTLEGLFLTDADFDVIMQSDGAVGAEHGHVLIPVSLGENHQLTYVQGTLGQVTHEIHVDDDRDLITFDGGMHIWISQ